MAFQNILQSAKKFFGPDNAFFHGSQDRYETQQPQEPQQAPQPEMTAPQMNPQQQYEQQFAPPQGYQHPYAQQQMQMPPQQMEYQQQYQQPQPVQQEMTQPYQQGYRPPQQQSVNEPYVAPRNRRSAQHQQPQQQPPMQQMPQDQGNVVHFPGAAPQQAAQPAQQQKLPSTCVINTRNMSDCRNAIGILRAGDCVIAVMDTITDQTELRRYVDTLNGACFSLGCTMTRLANRVGVYLLAPAGVKVYTDNATTQMNGAARPQQVKQQRPAMQQPFQATPFQQPQQQGYQQPAPQQQPSPYQQMQYQQPVQPQPQQYQQQAPAQGYAPDAPEAEYNAM